MSAPNPKDLERFFHDRAAEASDREWSDAHNHLLQYLEDGRLRAAAPADDGMWLVHVWVKRAILQGFKRSGIERYDGPGYPMFDKAAYPPRIFTAKDGVRLVPGGSAVRRGAHLAKGVVIMPPAYVNVGAWVGEFSMIDSHVLVGSCAQIGNHVHLSAGAQIGGVLEPPGALPVIVEDEAFVGALAGVFEGVHVKRRAVLAAGVVLTASTVIHDLVQGRTWQGLVPEAAVVVPGTRPASGDYATAHALAIAAPLIVKYRDAGTDARTALESALR
jgi:2,3,4,5-tetrahydropyridine-2-carboxylate N-succinyltransferase